MSGWSPDTLSGPGNDTYVGSEFDDEFVIELVTEAGETVPILHEIDGGAGNDSLAGLGGNDKLFGGFGDDIVDGGTGDDYLSGGAGNDLVIGGDGHDVIGASSGDDTVYAGEGNDEIRPGPGNDLIDGGAGSDVVVFDSFRSEAHPELGLTEDVDVDPSQFRFSQLADGRVLVQHVGGTGIYGSDTLDGVETIVWNSQSGGQDTVMAVADLVCFLEGTLLATPEGERPVEALRAGDLVTVVSGSVPRARPVRWVGRRTVRPEAHPRPSSVFPVRIRAGALAEGVPKRDLLVSPEHALLLDGVLVPAQLLVDGRGILREPMRGRLRYFHVELDSHDLLLAEGAPTESYLDGGNRDCFDNAGPVRRLWGEAAPAVERAEGSCAPVITEGPVLEAIRRRLAARAATLSQPSAFLPGPVAESSLASRRLALSAGTAQLRA